MISSLASVTNCGRLSGVGYSDLTTSVHSNRQYLGWPSTFTIDVVCMPRKSCSPWGLRYGVKSISKARVIPDKRHRHHTCPEVGAPT